jgi:outer membrane protein OmpA-like peptidoglycan-associated protein
MSRSARVAGAIALWIGALAIGLYFTSSNDSDPEGPAADVAAQTSEAVTETTAAAPVTTPTTPAETTTTTTTPETTTTTTAPETTTTTTAPAATAAVVEASLVDGSFSVTGVVPNQAIADQILGAAGIVYGPEFTSDLVVDPEVEAPDWLAGAPRAVGLLPIIGQGSIRVDAAGVTLSGTSPNAEALTALEGAVAATLGVEPDSSGIEVTNLGFPTFNARRTSDQLVLTGALANDAVKSSIVGAARAIYSEAVVVDQITIGDNLDVPFWSYTMPGVLQLFAAFPDYEITIADGITGGSLNDGANFEIGETSLSPSTESIMPIALGIMTRDPSVGMEVAGHTDSFGSSDFNQQLSEARAQAAADWLIDNGIDPARIRVVGFGETQPIASNETSTGRASNRRVEFVFGPLAQIVGG